MLARSGIEEPLDACAFVPRMPPKAETLQSGPNGIRTGDPSSNVVPAAIV
jgi:hypothetical protein